MNDYLVLMRANLFDSLAPFWTPDMHLYENAMEVKGRASFDALVDEVRKTMTLTSIPLHGDANARAGDTEEVAFDASR